MAVICLMAWRTIVSRYIDLIPKGVMIIHPRVHEGIQKHKIPTVYWTIPVCQALCNALFFFNLISTPRNKFRRERSQFTNEKKKWSGLLKATTVSKYQSWLQSPHFWEGLGQIDEFGFNKGLPYNASVTWNGSRVGFPVRPAHHPI